MVLDFEVPPPPPATILGAAALLDREVEMSLAFNT